MTSEYLNRANPPPALADDKNHEETIQEAIRALKRVGLVVDSGSRKWSEQTGRYEILWRASSRCNGGYDPDECLCRDLPIEHLTDQSLTAECPLWMAKVKR